MAVEEAQEAPGGVRPATGARAARFSEWLQGTMAAEARPPWFGTWDKPLADRYGWQQADEAFGTYGLKRSYVRDTPLAK